MATATMTVPARRGRVSLGVLANAGLLVAAFLAVLALGASDAFAAQPAVGLGTADSFAVLAGATVTNTGPSTVNGDLGLSPGSAVTGFPPGTVNGTIHATDVVAGQAQSDLRTAYNDAAGRTPAVSESADLGGMTLTAGVYKSGSSLGLTGTLTLDAQGDPRAVFVFQAGSTLTTASGSRVRLINGAQACNVFWQVGSSAALGTSSVFAGSLLTLTSISVNDNVTIDGRALARNGAVTLINDTITASHCAPGTTGTTVALTGTPGTSGSTTQPNHGSAVLTALPRRGSTTITQGGSRCVSGSFRAVITGRFIRRVVFSLGSRVISSQTRSPFAALVRSGTGVHTVTARVTFSDATAAQTLRLRVRSCAAATGTPRRVRAPSLSAPPIGRGGLTG